MLIKEAELMGELPSLIRATGGGWEWWGSKQQREKERNREMKERHICMHRSAECDKVSVDDLQDSWTVVSSLHRRRAIEIRQRGVYVIIGNFSMWPFFCHLTKRVVESESQSCAGMTQAHSNRRSYMCAPFIKARSYTPVRWPSMRKIWSNWRAEWQSCSRWHLSLSHSQTAPSMPETWIARSHSAPLSHRISRRGWQMQVSGGWVRGWQQRVINMMDGYYGGSWLLFNTPREGFLKMQINQNGLSNTHLRVPRRQRRGLLCSCARFVGQYARKCWHLILFLNASGSTLGIAMSALLNVKRMKRKLAIISDIIPSYLTHYVCLSFIWA